MKMADTIRYIVTDYVENNHLQSLVLGISGGIDSALCAALLQPVCENLQIPLIGRSITIETNKSEEIERSIEVGNTFCTDFEHIDITHTFLENKKIMIQCDNSHLTKLRQGNMKARMRMMVLYDLAQLYKGIVISTDNYTEYLTGFWTLHGDVGDLSPIQSLTKSWEVPMMAKMMGVPESIWRATPTDGLGIDNGDEAQLGASYLEWDIMFLMLDFIHRNELALGDARATEVYKAVTDRIALTWFKRKNPMNLDHSFFSRYDYLEQIDSMFRPTIFD